MMNRLFGVIKSASNISDEISNYISASPLISPDRMPLISAGINAFVNADYLACVHILVFKIEGCIRDLIGSLGYPVISVKDVGEFQFRILTDLLETARGIKGT